jgi:hypothetical protein
LIKLLKINNLIINLKYMPLIRLDYDNEKLEKKEIIELSNAIQKIVSEITQIEDVFVYANSSEIKVKIAPIEIFIEMSAYKIKNSDDLISEIKSKLKDWKKENNFSHLINLTIIPMEWKIEI